MPSTEELEKLKKIVSEEKNPAKQNEYLVKLLNFDKAFELVENHVRHDHYIPIQDIVVTDVPFNTTFILPVPQTRKQLWFIVSRGRSTEKCQELRVGKATLKSLKDALIDALLAEKKISILINSSFLEMLQ